MCHLHFFTLLLVTFSPISANDAGKNGAEGDSYEYYEPEKLREYDSYYDYEYDEDEEEEEEDEEDGNKHQGENASNRTENYYRCELKWLFYFSLI